MRPVPAPHQPPKTLSPSCAPDARPDWVDILGRTEPRLWTPPLVELTPETSYGFDVCFFARTVLGEPLDPWQEWAAIHLGELLPDGRPRFQIVIILVARQNGKSYLARALSLYWLYVDRVSLVLGLSSTREYAMEQLHIIHDIASDNPILAEEIKCLRGTTGQESLILTAGRRYKIAARNRKAGRSLTINRIVADELREHDSWDAWNASKYATNAVPDAQIVAITNQGDDRAIVLDTFRDAAIERLETGRGDRRLGLFEWSSPDGADPRDIDALAQANPNLGRRLHPESLLGDAETAISKGGLMLGAFRTEVMCQKVRLLDPAIDPDQWARCATRTPIDLADHRDKVALCLDVSLDERHASLIAAAVVDDVVRIDVVRAWSGPDAMVMLRRELPQLVAKVKPRVLGWFPQGPAASISADLAKRRGWPPRGVEQPELTAETRAVCMGLAQLAKTAGIEHAADPMLDAHIGGAQRLRRGDGFVFARRGSTSIDGAYAAAGAVHLARTLTPPLSPLCVA